MLKKLEKHFHNIKKKFYVVATCLGVFTALMGFVAFPCFILEESIQMATFGSWAAKEAGDWNQLEEGLFRIDYFNRKLKWLNGYFGWLNPFGYMSYKSYASATDYFVNSNIVLIDNKRYRKKVKAENERLEKVWSSRKCNLNTAKTAELESLPRIGPARASYIIKARPFRKVSDLTRVPGIGEKTLEMLKDRVTVESNFRK